MAEGSFALWLLAQEARALMTRLARIKPFALSETMVPAASLLPQAQIAIEKYLVQGRRELRNRLSGFLSWLATPAAQLGSPAEAQRRFTNLRLRFNAVLAQFDLFSVVITQRSEHETGVWLSGLDAIASDALQLPQPYFDAPPVVCYLDRGLGAAIRRARTRLPGGGDNPVAVIRVPRERMVGSGIASSLVHEVGHQGAALLDLVNSLRRELRQRVTEKNESTAWQYWERWISEIVADFWAVSRLGISATTGLFAVVSLPSAFVFRITLDDPHPFPWIRVKLSCAMGHALHPHPQWARLAKAWQQFYPLDNLDPSRREIVAMLEEHLPEFVALLINHRPPTLRGNTLGEVLAAADRAPAELATYHQQWSEHPELMRSAPPSLALAVIGQARAEGQIAPEVESQLIGNLLTYWALRTTLDTSAVCALQPRVLLQGKEIWSHAN